MITALEYAYAAGGRTLWHEISEPARSPADAALSLTTGEALIMITLLSLGLWAAIWAAVASLGLALL
jgi:hypothetical protein